ncbi:MAG: hypothetical protein PHU40_05145 [Sulfurimonas sp.]|nr:hypothetical protein [Sulfurimonas sp.]
MKILWAFLFLLLNLQASDILDISLNEFAERVSKQNNVNIYIDEDFQEKIISLYIPETISNDELMTLFRSSVSSLGFSLSKRSNTYYLSKKSIASENVYIYKMKYDSFSDCENILKSYGVVYSYLKDSNSFTFKTLPNTFLEIQNYLDQVDVIQEQVMLKIMIFEYTDNNIKDIGVEFGSIYQSIDGGVKYALNALVGSISTNSPIISSNDYYFALKLLNEHKIINVRQFPYVLAKNNKTFKFEAVDNIPYLMQTTTTEATNTSQQDSYQYKDVGLKINGKSFIYDDFISLDLDLVVEDILSGSESNVPQTFKRVLQSNTNITYNQVLVLSGLKRIKTSKTDYSVPYISNIPYLGAIFKHESTNDEEINISISIEVINTKQNEGLSPPRTYEAQAE